MHTGTYINHVWSESVVVDFEPYYVVQGFPCHVVSHIVMIDRLFTLAVLECEPANKGEFETTIKLNYPCLVFTIRVYSSPTICLITLICRNCHESHIDLDLL